MKGESQSEDDTQLGYLSAAWPWDSVHKDSLQFLLALSPNNP